MVFRDLFADTVRTLWSHKLRTFLSMFGIAWGIVSITLMVAAGEGLRVGLQKQGESFGKDIMIVFAGRTSMEEATSPTRVPFGKDSRHQPETSAGVHETSRLVRSLIEACYV